MISSFDGSRCVPVLCLSVSRVDVGTNQKRYDYDRGQGHIEALCTVCSDAYATRAIEFQSQPKLLPFAHLAYASWRYREVRPEVAGSHSFQESLRFPAILGDVLGAMVEQRNRYPPRGGLMLTNVSVSIERDVI